MLVSLALALASEPVYSAAAKPLPVRPDLADLAETDAWNEVCGEVGLEVVETRIGQNWLHQECRAPSYDPERVARDLADLEGDGWRPVQLVRARDGEGLQRLVLARVVGAYHPLDVVQGFVHKYGGDIVGACAAGEGWVCHDELRAVQEGDDVTLARAQLRVGQEGRFYEVVLHVRRDEVWDHQTVAFLQVRDVTAAIEATQRVWSPPSEETLLAIQDQL